MSGFGGNHEGASSTWPPLLTGVNYASWKDKMEAYVCQIHDRAWMAIEDGYAPPMMTPMSGGEQDSKLQVLQTQFELLKMEEDECFNDFEVKLMDIVNQSHQLGDPYSDRRVKQKIMRSLPARFESKVTVLEENSTYKDMKPSEVIGRILAYKSRKAPSISPPKKQKGIALNASKVVKKEKGDSDQDMALLLRRFKKFVKFENKGVGSKGQDLKKKAPFKNFEPRKEHSEKKGVQCYECGGIGQISPDCGNMKNKMAKMMATTWSESDDSRNGDKSSSDDELTVNYTAFGATCVDDKVVGKNDLTSDPIKEKDEEVALEKVNVATYWDMALIDSRDHGEGLNGGNDSISEKKSGGDNSSEDDSSSNSTNGSVEKMDVNDFIVKCESSLKKNNRKLKILEDENLELSTHNDHLSNQVEASKKIEDKLRDELAMSKRNEEG
ncbi:hypothetical protein Q3G72_007535 [Acer saccharum]|nr:hypothetical protein Q3G72_007535 [Acer saccharum]